MRSGLLFGGATVECIIIIMLRMAPFYLLIFVHDYYVAAMGGIGFRRASRIYTILLTGPGTGPLTSNSPNSSSILTTCRFSVVILFAPICPAIFLPGRTLPGSWLRQYRKRNGRGKLPEKHQSNLRTGV